MNRIIICVLLIAKTFFIVNAQKNSVNTTVVKTNTTQPIFVEEVKKVENEITITYKKYKLTNGLTILVHEDHSDPICYVDVTYHVGSAREQEGRSGFAHFFEHMMFQGSKNVADEQHFKIITEAGGTLNGTTNTDRTNYFETVPSNQLEKMLWLEADRMGFLLDSVTQKKFEVQRATVKNERGQRYDNAPYGLVNEKIGEALYPQGHPYSWSTIGYLVDLDRVDVNDLKRFYMRWYGPNNAVLTVAGDVNTDEVLLMAQKYFGSIEKGPDVKKQIVPPFKLTENRYISYEDQVKFPLINFAYQTVPANHKDEVALRVLSMVLSQTEGSPFYKGFIETQKAFSAYSYQYSRELAGMFVFSIKANQGTMLSEIEKEVKKILTEWEKKGPTDDDVIKFKAGYNSNLLDRLSTVQGKGATLASYYTLYQDANYLKKEISNNMAVTKADVMRVYNTYIKNKPAVILSCLPKGKTDLKANADNWKMYERLIETESNEYKNLSFKEPKDDFNRAIMPEAKKASPVPVPNFYTSVVHKIPLIGVQENETPKINILISFKAGHFYESIDKSGVSELLSRVLSKSTQKTTSEEIENRLDKLGSGIQYTSGAEDISVIIDCDKKTLTQTLKILQESLFEPKFDIREFELEKQQLIDEITQALTNAEKVADLTFKKMLYGENHILGFPENGTLESVKNLTVEDVKKHYGLLNNGIASIAVSGDVSMAEINKELTFLSKLKDGMSPPLSNTIVPKIEKTKIYFVDKKNAAQSEIRVGYVALPYEALGDFYKASIMNFSFSNAFNSRVNFLLREVKGWTYGVRGGFSGTKYPGIYSIGGGFKSNSTDSTLIEIFKELREFVNNGIKDDEINFTKNAMTQADALKYESPIQKLFFVKRVLDYNLPKDYVAKQNELLNSISKNEINNLAKKYLPYNNMVIVIVGDKATNLEKVKKLGFDVTEIDTNGKPIN